MILIDTNIIINLWKGKDAKYRNLIVNSDICICTVILSELLIGASNDKEFENIINAVSEFEILYFNDAEWLEFSKFRYRLRRNGVNVPYQDSVIAYIAMKNNCEILTDDKHFKLIQSIFPELKLIN